jgi:hypothetical protein
VCLCGGGAFDEGGIFDAGNFNWVFLYSTGYRVPGTKFSTLMTKFSTLSAKFSTP